MTAHRQRIVPQLILLSATGALCCALPSTAWAQDPSEATGTYVLTGGMLLDGYESSPLHDAGVVVENGRITWVGPAADVEIPSGAQVLDVRGKTILPGLIDLHVHVDLIGHGDYARWYDFIGGTRRLTEMAAISAGQMVRAGVTTAVDLGAPLDVMEVRDRILAGTIPGPRLILSGPWITRVTLDGVPMEYQNVVDSPEAAVEAAEALIAAGAEVIKTWILPEEELRAVVATAHAHGIAVHTHLYSPENIRAAIRSGVDVLQHVGSAGNPPYDPDLVAEIAHKGIPIVQTIAHRIWVYPATVEFPERLQDSRLRSDFPEDVFAEVQESFRNFERLDYFKTTARQIRNSKVAARQFINAGAVMGVGTDAASPMNFHTEAMWRELEALVESGMTPIQALSAATQVNAEILGLADEIGTVEPGKVADILVVSGNPLASIRELDRVHLVIAAGRLVEVGR